MNQKGHAVFYNSLREYNFLFEIGDIVYLKTDPDQAARMVTGYMIRDIGVSYALSFDVEESWHYGFEISDTRDEVKVFSS